MKHAGLPPTAEAPAKVRTKQPPTRSRWPGPLRPRPQGPVFLPQQPSCSSKGLRAQTRAGCPSRGHLPAQERLDCVLWDFATGNGKMKSLLRCFCPFRLVCWRREFSILSFCYLHMSAPTRTHVFTVSFFKGQNYRLCPVPPKACCPWEGCGWPFSHRRRTPCFVFVHCGAFCFSNVGCVCKTRSEGRPPVS